MPVSKLKLGKYLAAAASLPKSLTPTPKIDAMTDKTPKVLNAQRISPYRLSLTLLFAQGRQQSTFDQLLHPICV